MVYNFFFKKSASPTDKFVSGNGIDKNNNDNNNNYNNNKDNNNNNEIKQNLQLAKEL